MIDVERDQRLLRVRERLADHQVDARLGRPADLLVEHGAGPSLRLGVVGLEDVRVADVAGEQRAVLRGDIAGDLQRLAVDRLEVVLAADQRQLLAVGVVRERLHDVGTGVDELAVQLGDQRRLLEHDLRHERARLQVAPPLELEQITLGADDGSLAEPIEEPAHDQLVKQ